MSTHLLLRLKAPLASAGVEAGEELRGAGDVPTRSMVLGLIGNALGLDRMQPEDMRRLDRLQAGTHLSVLMLSRAGVWTDVQNARAAPAYISGNRRPLTT